MALAIVYSRANVGVNAPLITIEVHLGQGLPCFNMVGLPEAPVRESRDRVRSALINCGFEFPNGRITVNLAPADLPKEGGRFDLAIAMGIICASGQLDNCALHDVEMVGELALSGTVRPVSGILPSAHAAHQLGRTLCVAPENAAEAAFIKDAKVLAVTDLPRLFRHLKGVEPLALTQPSAITQIHSSDGDMTDIIGQTQAKRALEIAAAGQHNLLFCGPPGTGKTMLASRLTGILPPMSEQQALEAATVRSVLGKPVKHQHWLQRPFRSPHHTCSAAALVGGGSVPRPGEISLAHNGVLFLDELPEFERRVLDVLREPLESGEVCISRAASQARFPSRFQLIAAMNPSPTGSVKDRRCSAEQVLRYLNRISGPFLDRIDLQVDVPRTRIDTLAPTPQLRGESSDIIRARVVQARECQLKRRGKVNALLNNREVQEDCRLSDSDRQFITQCAETLGLSLRALHRSLKVARTIADLANAATINREHLAEAMSYRAFDAIIQQLTRQ